MADPGFVRVLEVRATLDNENSAVTANRRLPRQQMDGAR
jgi:hypothetical protein